MDKEFYLRCKLGSKSIWAKVDSCLFYSYYFDHYICVKHFSCVRNGIKHEYFTFFTEGSNGLAYPNSIVKFMVMYV